jgi:hypothetical protein
MTISFWKGVVASLPPEVQRRYARDLAAAERYEPMLDLAIEIAGIARRVLGRCCRVVAQGLRVSAALLEAAAWRLALRR